MENINIPSHVGIIMDGNWRWARKNGLPFFEGHKQGAAKVKEVARWCRQRGIKILTLYAFSVDNWGRSSNEINYLMELFASAFKKDIKEFYDEGGKLRVIGQKEKLPHSLQKLIEKAEELTKDNEFIVNLAISYSGREEITQAVRKIIEERIPADEINQRVIQGHLLVSSDIDLLIRTSEERISDFMLWQVAYAELYFLIDKYWPDFTEDDLDGALAEYAKRQRRFGKRQIK